jgi:predicted DNA-binding transcriptional regulator
MAWIGYTLATTPPPVPLEDLNLEEEVEEPK